MTDCNMREAGAKQLRLKLVGKPLVGFDTRSWHARATDGSTKGRTGAKAGAKVGGKAAPARA